MKLRSRKTNKKAAGSMVLSASHQRLVFKGEKVEKNITPTVETTGSYSVNQTQQQSMMCLPQDYESALEALLTEVRKNKALQAELDETKALLAEEREYFEMLSKSRSFSLHNES